MRSELGDLQAAAACSASAAHLIHTVAEFGTAVELLEVGDLDPAREAVLTGLESRYMGLVASLKAEQDSIQASISDNTAAASRTNGCFLFFLTLAVPAAADVVYWVIARRQVRDFRLQSELELDAERAVSKAQVTFIAGLSDELRTPLESIYGFAEILTYNEAGDAAQVSELSQIIANEATEMTRMVDDLLAASHMESTGLEIELSATRVADSSIAPLSHSKGPDWRSASPRRQSWSRPTPLVHGTSWSISSRMRRHMAAIGSASRSRRVPEPSTSR